MKVQAANKGELMDNRHLLNDFEMIQVGSGSHYKVLNSDLSFFTIQTTVILRRFINKETIIAFFLPIDQMNFSQLVIYNACIELGAAMIRCTVSDIERQIPVSHNIKADYIIIERNCLKYIKDTVQFDRCIFFEDINSSHPIEFTDEHILTIYDFYNIPGFLIIDKENNVYCPGYKLKEYDTNRLTVTICKHIGGFYVKDMEINIGAYIRMQKENNDKILSSINYINTQIKFLFKNQLNIKIDKNNIILDSLGMIELLVYIENEFGITVPIDRIKKSDFMKLDQLTLLVSNLALEGFKN